MLRRSTLTIAAAAAMLVGCGAASQPQSQLRVASARCDDLSAPAVAEVYAPKKVIKVEPTYERRIITRGTTLQYVSGANLYVPAQPGMNEAYLERVLSCHAAGAATAGDHPNDPLRVSGIEHVDVASAGPTMRIAIKGTNAQAGKAIYQRSQAYRQPQGAVSVEQLSAAPGTHNAL